VTSRDPQERGEVAFLAITSSFSRCRFFTLENSSAPAAIAGES
jgi:hypothetical protein